MRCRRCPRNCKRRVRGQDHWSRLARQGREGAAGDDGLTRTDDDLSEHIAGDLGSALDTGARPKAACVTRWDRALPQYEVGHLERVDAAEASLRSTPGVALAGAGYRGSGIPDCIASAEGAVALVSVGDGGIH